MATVIVDTNRGTNERERRIRARNRALLAVLLGLVALFYAITIVRLSGG
jgi:hypothetical protein